MKFINETLQTPITREVDVLVAGAGPAGVAAAIKAGRQGASVMLVEQLGDVGGQVTSGMMSHWSGRTTGKIYQEIEARQAAKLNISHMNDKHAVDPAAAENVMLEMLAEAGVKLRLYTFASGAVMEGNRLKGIIAESKSGREAFLAKVVIDATGDGDIAAKAGAEFFKGREEDGKMQPATLIFKVGGVDYKRAVFLPGFENTYETEKGELQALARQHLPAPAGHVLLYRATAPGVVTCNMTNVTGVDGTNADDLTRASLVCRGQLEPIVKFLREFVPGYENCYLLNAGSLVGVRETRHFKGVYTLTKDDILAARQFEDWVVMDAHFNFDVHNIEGAGADKTLVQKHFKQPNGYTIPYGCLVPEKIDGLLFSGRNISGTHMAHSNFRVMRICAAIGEAGGAAAAIAVKRDIDVRDVKASEIQKTLEG